MMVFKTGADGAWHQLSGLSGGSGAEAGVIESEIMVARTALMAA